MLTQQKTIEKQSWLPAPDDLLDALRTMATEEKKFAYLRNIFLEVEDVDAYIDFITDGPFILTRQQTIKLKAVMVGYRVYLEDYLQRTKKSIEKFDQRFQRNARLLANPDLSLEETTELAEQRISFSLAMSAIANPRGGKGKSLREVTQRCQLSSSMTMNKLLPEEINKYLADFRTRFDSLSQLHEGIEWAEVEKSLREDPSSMAKLKLLDDMGHKLMVLGEQNGEFIFVSAWDNVDLVNQSHRSIVYDKDAETWYRENNPFTPLNGNAVDIAKTMNVDLASPEHQARLRKVLTIKGWAWLKTDAASKKTVHECKYEPSSTLTDFYEGVLYSDLSIASFRALLRVKKCKR